MKNPRKKKVVKRKRKVGTKEQEKAREDARLRARIIGALRKVWMYHPYRREALEKAFIRKKTNTKTGRLAKFFQCAYCDDLFPQKEISIDHIDPIIDPKVGFIDFNTYIDRMFTTNLQALCNTCHITKTNNERALKKLHQKKP